MFHNDIVWLQPFTEERKIKSKLYRKQHKANSSKNARSLDFDDTLSEVTYTLKERYQKIS